MQATHKGEINETQKQDETRLYLWNKAWYRVGVYNRMSGERSHDRGRREMSCQPWFAWYCLLLGPSLLILTLEGPFHMVDMFGRQWDVLRQVGHAKVIFIKVEAWERLGIVE